MHSANILIASTEVHVIKEALSVSSDMVTTDHPTSSFQNSSRTAQSSLFSQKNEIRYLSKTFTERLRSYSSFAAARLRFRPDQDMSKCRLSTEEATALSYMDGWELKVLWNDEWFPARFGKLTSSGIKMNFADGSHSSCLIYFHDMLEQVQRVKRLVQ